MISSMLKVAGYVFVVCLVVHAQNPVKKTPTSSISGRVTHKGNGIAGIVVGARVLSNSRPTTSQVVTTDQDGNYRISNVVPGEYEVVPAAPQFVLSGRQAIKTLIIGEGETVEGVDFTLVRGGVITGKVTDEDGRPIIEESVEFIGPEGQNGDHVARMNIMNYPTDDRGVYRLYGLPPGKYRVAAGIGEDRLSVGRGRRAVYTQTFYPSTTELAKATVIEVTEGGEATNIDIILRRTQPAFTVIARVIDADTGQPIPDVRYGIEKYRENGGSSTSGFSATRRGEIRLENVTPGKYGLFVERSPQRDVYAEPLRFEVVDQDIKDLVIKASSGSSISGVVVFEGVDQKVVRDKLTEMILFAHVHNTEITEVSSTGNAGNGLVNADGSFTVSGLRAGVVQFTIWTQHKGRMSEFEVVRIERDGVAQANLEIKTREQIKGLRVVLRPRSGRIGGMVKVENGQLSPDSFIQIQVRRVGDEKFGMSIQLDARGRFMSEPLTAGVYEVSVMALQARGRASSTKQQVVVSDNQVSEITLTLDLKTDTGSPRP